MLAIKSLKAFFFTHATSLYFGNSAVSSNQRVGRVLSFFSSLARKGMRESQFRREGIHCGTPDFNVFRMCNIVFCNNNAILPTYTASICIGIQISQSFAQRQKPNSWRNNFVEVSGQNLESFQTWGFHIQCLHYKPVSNHFCSSGVGGGG
jgi:hypothetical protein